MTFIENLFGLQSKVAVVTGGTGVLGGAMCRALARAGASVVIVGRRLQLAEALACEITKEGGRAMAVAADVLNKEQVQSACDHVLKHYGRIDILVNGAGGNIPGAVVAENGSFTDLSMDDFKRVVDLNLAGTVLPSQIFSKPMVERQRGVIVNISSMAAVVPLTRVVGYAAAKAAVSNFTQWLSVELSRKYGEGIRVNAIAPGFFLTEQNQTLLTLADGSLTERGKVIIARTPFGRFGVPDDLVGTLLWLCSDASSFVSGIVVPVDGGFSAFSGV